VTEFLKSVWYVPGVNPWLRVCRSDRNLAVKREESPVGKLRLLHVFGEYTIPKVDDPAAPKQ
jgi:hypothetical protein